MTEPKKKRVSRKLSKKEQDLVKELSDSMLELKDFAADDARKRIIREVVEHKYGGYTVSLEKLAARPRWDKVFSLRACPACNPHARNMGRLMPSKDGLECRVCHLKLSNEIFEKARQDDAREIRWHEKQRQITRKIEKQGIKKQQLERLMSFARNRVQAEVRKRQQLLSEKQEQKAGENKRTGEKPPGKKGRALPGKKNQGKR